MHRAADDTEGLATLVSERRLVVCVGSGGVGKTTCSAVVGLHAALSGRKVLVLTIDPAKRLANSLGVDALDNEAQRVPLDPFAGSHAGSSGELWATMLDMKESFDQLVHRYAPSEENKQEILGNRFYRYFSSSLSGSQEYAAAERLYELFEDTDFDLLVLDTPPAAHALDFLEAPTRLAEAIENKALQWVYKPGVLSGRSGLGLFSSGTSRVMNTLGKFTGAELLSEMGTFLQAFSTLFEGLGERARSVEQMLTGPECTFLVVTSPDPLTLEEALEFHQQLGEKRVAVGGFIVNRVHPHWVALDHLDQTAEHLASALTQLRPGPFESRDDLEDFAHRLLENGRDFTALAVKDQKSIGRLTQHVSRETPVGRIPYFSEDVHSLDGLRRVRMSLFGE